MFKGRIYNPETKGYSYYIPVDEIESFKDKLTQLEARMDARSAECRKQKEGIEKTDEELEINNLESVEHYIKELKNLNTPINQRGASLFLIACFFCRDKDIINHLIDNYEVEINRVDMLGFNALTSLILNEHMYEEDKLELIKKMLDKGIDIDWQNIEGKSAIIIALETVQPDICNLLLDYDAYVD